MKKYAVIVAGGIGSRMQSSVPKQFLLINGKSLLWYTLNTFLRSYTDLEIILVLPEQHVDTGSAIVNSTGVPGRIQITTGGATRFHSVKNGLEYVTSPSIVFVHDAVRAMVSTTLIQRSYETALKLGNAIPAIQPQDSFRKETAEGNEIIDRNSIRMIQTPQTFSSDIILSAFEQDYNESFTDEASVVENTGVKINLIEGEITNIKITQPIDLQIAEKILDQTGSNNPLNFISSAI